MEFRNAAVPAKNAAWHAPSDPLKHSGFQLWLGPSGTVNSGFDVEPYLGCARKPSRAFSAAAKADASVDARTEARMNVRGAASWLRGRGEGLHIHGMKSSPLKSRIGELKTQSLLAATMSDEDEDLRLQFSDGTQLRGTFWRLFRPGNFLASSFDLGEIYGNEGATNSQIRGTLEYEVKSQIVKHAAFSPAGDLMISLENGFEIQIFNFTGYEVWEIQFPDGTSEYSNFWEF